ncbi:hypothetical protein JMJ78_0000983 [Colletotrichum scovillei]|nr:hypothetical protein JMJ78_0000983 [Colletotrichum scovillei]
MFGVFGSTMHFLTSGTLILSAEKEATYGRSCLCTRGVRPGYTGFDAFTAVLDVFENRSGCSTAVGD